MEVTTARGVGTLAERGHIGKGKKVNVKLVVTADNAPKVTAKATVKVKKK